MMNDKETKEILSEQEAIKFMLKSDGWGHADRRLLKKIGELTDIMNFEDDDPHKLMVKVAVAQEAAKILLEWRAELMGEAKHISNYANLIQGNSPYSHIKKY